MLPQLTRREVYIFGEPPDLDGTRPALFPHQGGISGRAGMATLGTHKGIKCEILLRDIVAAKAAIIREGGRQTFEQMRAEADALATYYAERPHARLEGWLANEQQAQDLALGQRAWRTDEERQRLTLEAQIVRRHLQRIRNVRVLALRMRVAALHRYANQETVYGAGHRIIGNIGLGGGVTHLSHHEAGMSGGGAQWRKGGDAITPATLHDPLHSQAFQRATHDPAYADLTSHVPGIGDPLLHDLIHQNGGDGLPQLVSKAEMDAHIAAGEQELWHGFAHPDHLQTFLHGDFYVGQGTGGSGHYVAMARSLAEQYNQGGLLRMSLKSGARVITTRQLEATRQAYLKATPSGPHDEAMLSIVMNNGRYAASLGYDAIRDESFGEMIIVNRTALRVQQGG